MTRSLRRITLALVALLTLAVASATPSLAHRLKLFATLEGEEIVGQAYFGGGKFPRDMVISVTAPDGRTLGETTTNAEGRFRFPISESVDHVLSAATPDGHGARFTLPLGMPSEGDGRDAPNPRRTPATGAASLDIRALDQRLRPLEERLQSLEDSLGFRDILGGIGYILGLFGLAAWMAAKRRKG